MAGVICDWGLPAYYKDSWVPWGAVEFCRVSIHLDIEEARRRAEDLGYQPDVRPLPSLGEDCYGFRLCVDGGFVPLMAKVILRTH